MELPGVHAARASTHTRRDYTAEIEALYLNQAERCGRLAFLLTGDHEQAQELVQEAFARLLARWRRIKNRDALEGYLRQTVINLARKGWRRRGHEQAYLRANPPANLGVAPADVETREQFRVLLSGLPFKQRATVVLRYYEDLPEREIALLLGCPIGTVKSSLSRALSSLRTELEEENE